jgi:hypothetical protein
VSVEMKKKKRKTKPLLAFVEANKAAEERLKKT